MRNYFYLLPFLIIWAYFALPNSAYAESTQVPAILQIGKEHLILNGTTLSSLRLEPNMNNHSLTDITLILNEKTSAQLATIANHHIDERMEIIVGDKVFFSTLIQGSLGNIFHLRALSMDDAKQFYIAIHYLPSRPQP